MQLTRKPSNLPAVQTVRAVAIPNNSGAALVTIDQPGKSVRQAIGDIIIAYRPPGLSDEDKRRLCEIFLKMVAGYPRAVVEHSLEDLLENNPRCTPTFAAPPTPVDVKQACTITHGRWQRWVAQFYYCGEWAKPSTDEFLKKDNSAIMRRYYAAQRGGKPGEPDCIVPFELCIEYLREWIEKEFPELQNAEERMRNGYSEALLLKIKDEFLDRMPEAAFPDGALEKIRSIRADRSEKARKAAEHEAYLASLTEEVRAVRSTVAYAGNRADWTEDQIMAETQKRLALVDSARAEAAAKCEPFYRYDFEDGETYFAPRTYGRAERDAEEGSRSLKRKAFSI